VGGIFVGNTVDHSGKETSHSEKKSLKWYKSWKLFVPMIFLVLLLAAVSFYQATHFNPNVHINAVNVSGLTANKALKLLQTSELKNNVYIGEQQIVDGKDTQTKFTDKDLQEVEELLKSQWTFFPSFKTKEYSLMPSESDQYRSSELKKELEKKLHAMNEDLPAPKDAQVVLEEGKIIVSKSVDGKQYDVSGLLAKYESHGYTSEIHLDPIFNLPVKEDSEIIKNEKQKLQDLLAHTVDYQVQDKSHFIKGRDVINNASVSKDLKVSIDSSDIEQKVAEINATQSTLGKDFSFTTTSGGVISVKGQGYGWALDVEKETELVKAAFEIGKTSISPSNIIGNGWQGEGYGYDTTKNNGIGDTYAEVSVAEQRIWLYRDGKQVFTTNVVTGKNSTGEDTSPGVWYILFKRTPYTLNGTSVGSGTYSVEVDYWAPFTNSGQGFHDASWRTNWNSNAYLNAGSGGCVNVQPSVMKQVYDNLSPYQPVVVY
jgi:hypothetical protein